MKSQQKHRNKKNPLTQEIEEIIEENVKSGRYISKNEVVLQALRLLREWENLHAAQTESIRNAVAEGVAELERGEGLPGEEVIQELRRKNAHERRRRAG